ncbi:MAG: hypothetical protein ACI808_000764 [Paraglaciecola sp.]|jgi:uncharacterized protein YdeI (YjbR/CyaY-like superfamily)
MHKSKSPENFIDAHPQWRHVLEKLRQLLLSTELEECIKWGVPTYCINTKNVVGLGAFNSYAGLWFFNGALLKDKAKVLVNAQDGKTQAMRQWRFGHEDSLDEPLLLSYILEAINNQKLGKEIKASRNKPIDIPQELSQYFSNNPECLGQFEQLGLSRQRKYAEYISTAKRQTTKQSRLEKIIPMILQGIGLNDQYR